MEKTTFQGQTLYVGIDVHKRQWSVSIYSQEVHHKTFSQPPYPDSLKAYLDKHFPGATVQCAYEACKFGFWIQRELASYGYDCMVINPADIPSSNRDVAGKTDPVDSRKIAKALRGGMLTPIHVPAPQTEGQRQLFRYRKKLWADLVRIKNRIKGKLMASGVEIPPQYDNPQWTRAFLGWLREVPLETSTRLSLDFLLEQYDFTYSHLLKVNTEVRKIQKQPGMRENARLLRTIPGIGPLTTVHLLTEIEDINRFPSFKHLNSYVGFKPMSHSSGERDWQGRITYRKNNALRSALIECAWTAIQKDPAMLACYQELKKRMTGKRAIVKIARKLLSRIYHVLKHQEPYEIGVVK